MKILIYGAGVVGATYGWQLSQAGHEVSVLVKKGKKQIVENNGIYLHCTDFRDNKKQVTETVFRPLVIDELSPENDYEFIIVTVNNIQLQQVLSVLSQSAGKANILFFQNNWDSFDEIANYLAPEQYFFGFPFMVGGGTNEKGINCAISGLKYSYTPVGELNGELTPRVQKIVKVLEDAKLKPVMSKQIKEWLISHYAVAAGLSAGIIKAGSAANFTKNTAIIKETIKAIKEGLNICRKRGINPKDEKSNSLYYLPPFIAAAMAKKIYGNEALQLMFDGHTKHSPDEMGKMVNDIIENRKKYKVETPNLKKKKNYIIGS
jgi:2-dehydropantoate 2-reductase